MAMGHGHYASPRALPRTPGPMATLAISYAGYILAIALTYQSHSHSQQQQASTILALVLCCRLAVVVLLLASALLAGGPR